MTPTTMIEPDFSAIPAQLATLPRWVVWKARKVPFCATLLNSPASVTDPGTWSSSDQAQAAYEEGGYEGVGFVLNGDGIAGLDLDKCVHAGTPDPAALQLLERVGCEYIEVSPSGTGLRGFGYHDGASVAGTSGCLDGVKIELYTTKRYLTVTGHTLAAGPLVRLQGFAELAQAVRGTGLQKSTEEDPGNLPSSSVGLLDIPVHTLPQKQGQRHRCLFELARYLRGTVPAATKEELRVRVYGWHAMALPVIGTKEFAISWGEFLHAWERVRHPFGSVLQGVLTSADNSAPLPERFLALGYQEAALRLMRICAALQAHHASEPFFLGARKAGELVDMHYPDAAKMLGAFVADGVLTLISKGAGRKASRYRFNG